MEVELEYKGLKYKINIDEKILETYKDYHNPSYVLEFTLEDGVLLMYAKKISDEPKTSESYNRR
jgi:hypothetical protein